MLLTKLLAAATGADAEAAAEVAALEADVAIEVGATALEDAAIEDEATALELAALLGGAAALETATALDEAAVLGAAALDEDPLEPPGPATDVVKSPFSMYTPENSQFSVLMLLVEFKPKTPTCQSAPLEDALTVIGPAVLVSGLEPLDH